MRKLLLGFLVFLSLSSTAQVKKLEMNFKGKASIGSYNTYTIFNKEKDRVCILAVGDEEVKGYILDKNYILVKEFAAEKLSVGTILVGGYFTGDKIHYLLGKDENDDILTHCVYDPVSGQSDRAVVNLEIRKAMFMGALSLGDQFFFISVKKKEDKINIYRFGKKDKHEVLEFTYPAEKIGEESLHNAFSQQIGFSRTSEISYINDWESPSVDKAKNYSKLYYRQDSIFILTDKSVSLTRVLALDLVSQKISLSEIKRTFEPYKDRTFSQNSFLLGNYLYSVVCCYDALQLTVHDFYTGKILRQYVTEKDEEISFRNTDIIQEGSTYFSSEERKLEKAKQLLRKMTNGRAMIIARNAGASEVELTIGSYTLVRSPGGGGMWMSGAPGTAPVYMPTGGFSRTWTKSARFKTLLHVDDFEKTNGEIQIPLEEKIEKFTKDIKIPEGCEGIYPLGDQLGYYYLDRKAKKLVVASL